MTARADQLRDRARHHPEWHVFVALSAETGDGPVVAVKDVVDVAGLPTTAGSLVLPGAPAERDAPVITRIRAGAAVVIGKTNLHEFALGASSVNPHFGAVANPAAPGYIAGGSSGGSAAAVGFGLCDWAIGSDTAGSIRIPATLCGVVGFKPTVGVVDTDGTVAVSPTLDVLGPLAPDVATTAAAFALMSARPAPAPASAPPALAVPAGWGEDLHPDIAAVFAGRTRGLPRVDFPEADRLRRAGATIMRYEAARQHEERLARNGGAYGADVRELLTAALSVTTREYEQALAERAELTEQAEAALAGWDALVAPVTRRPAVRIGAPYANGDYTDYTRPFSTTGQPVLTLPAGRTAARHPVGLQLVGRCGADTALLAVGAAVERSWRTGGIDEERGSHDGTA